MKAVDLFAGFGGMTLGASWAGVTTVWAANHWALACQTHGFNHPDVEHVCQDLRQADWTRLPRYELLLAAPACQGHSTASQPKRRLYHDALRATAWSVIDCAEVTRPRAIVVENVPSFRTWELYPLWLEALRKLGYTPTEHLLLASRHGVPQRRERLFVTATRSGRRAVLAELRGPEPAFGPCIEWDAGTWRPLAAATPNARARMRAAIARHGARCLSQHVSNHPGCGLDEAIRTVTTKDQWVVVRDGEYRPLTTREYARAMGFPDSYRWPWSAARHEVVRGLGNAVCPPVARDVVRAIVEAA